MTTTRPIPNIPQEQLDEEAVRAYILTKSYRKAAAMTHLTRAAVYRRVKRWLRRSEERAGEGREN
jgi:transposase-like protein